MKKHLRTGMRSALAAGRRAHRARRLVLAASSAAADRANAAHARQEALLDEALAETFPASDPISPSYIG
ncbi:hypothetical protein N0A02_28595 [Paraburkholderia acidicola]|uniref:Uncharacterized protein n=1 Tax=Paraburkholderia acidicola TaxID=1912599 RepID=A0ABV1LVR2_9BURK